MIFVTIGTQIAFDRLIRIVDELAGMTNETFVVQALNGDYIPKNFEVLNFIAPDEFNRFVEDARLIISHAGIGSILSAFDYAKPVIIFPRLASLKEHRNDHQMATAMAINEKGYAYVAYDKKQLKDLLSSVNLSALRGNVESKSNNILNSILKDL